MSRRSVRCPCGADFFIPEVAPALLHCPKCGEVVRFQKADGGHLPVRQDVDEPIRPLPPRTPYYTLYLLGMSGLVIIVGLVTLILVYHDREVRRHDAMNAPVRPKYKRKENEPLISLPEIPATPIGQKSVRVEPKAEPPGISPPPPAPPAVDVEAAMERFHRLTPRANLLGLTAAMMLHSGRSAESQALLAELSLVDAELRASSAQLAGRPEIHRLKDYFRPGDALVRFAGTAIDPAHPKESVAAIRDWLGTVQPGALVLANVRRGERLATISMWFPEITPELGALSARAGILTGIGDKGSAVAVPTEALAEVKRRFAALHPYFRKSLSPEDSVRLDRLIKDGRGTPEDLEFLKIRISPYLARAEAEMSGLRVRVQALEAAVAESMTLDLVVFKDGNRVHGQIDEETATELHLRGKFGAMRVLKSDLLRVDRGPALGAEFRRRYDAGKSKPDELEELLAWCREKHLAHAMELAATALLLLEPGHDAAWAAIGAVDRPAAPASLEFDAVWLKDGTKREGILSGETAETLQLDVILRGSKAEVMGTGRVSIPRGDVARVDRMNDEARKRAIERAASFSDRGRRNQEALARVPVLPDPGFGLRVTGSAFELRSTCPESVVRETALALEEIFDAFRKHFSVRRNAARRIDVFLFANADELAEFELKTTGAAWPAPAYFDAKSNHVAACYGVQKEEEARVRGLILKAERGIEQFKRDVAAEEDRVARESRALRQQVLDEAAQARKAAGEDAKAQAAVDRRKQEGLEQVKGYERAAMDRLAQYRQQANRTIDGFEAAIRANREALAAQTKGMGEVLFHEAFHAFAANFLWDSTDNAELPRWLHEGLACYFERSVVEGGHLIHGGVHPAHLALLKSLQKENQLIPVATIVTAGPEMFQTEHRAQASRPSEVYAHAWSLAHYLLSKGVTREQLETYAQNAGPASQRITAFERLAGKTLREVDVEWRVYIATLK